MKSPPIDKVQKRIANISIGPSTLRGQPEGTIKTAREFFINFNFGKGRGFLFSCSLTASKWSS